VLNRNLVALACSILVPLLVVSVAVAADGPERADSTVRILERPEDRFERSIDAHHERVAERRERRERREARRERRKERREARREERREAQAPDAAEVGVATSTLESIAACESGGDPGAVNAAGYYGKYQFDIGTWQSVGGSGNPAEAPESEQDHRAALLYSRAGASPWPVCGS